MTQETPPNYGRIVLTIVAQVLLGILALCCLMNLFQVDNLLLYSNRFFRMAAVNETRHWKDWAPIIGWLFGFIAKTDLILTPLALIFAIVRLHSPTFNGAMLAQVFAIANAFLTLFLWGFNAFAIAVGSMYDVSFPKSPLIMAIALALTNILAAGILSGVIRHHKQAAAPST